MELKHMYIESALKTPQIDFNSFTGEFILSGRSIPENAALVYEKVLLWVNDYKKHPKPVTNLRINLEYFNTSSAIWISKIVAALASIEENECTLIIHLYFNIEDYDDMEADDIKDELHPIINMIGVTSISVGIKIYGTNDNGEVIKESMVLI
jgi:hypothetical protein